MYWTKKEIPVWAGKQEKRGFQTSEMEEELDKKHEVVLYG